MYKINEANIENLSYIKPIFYSETLGLTLTLLYQLFNGKCTTKLSTAKSIISIAYNIPVSDEKMNQLLEKHFIKIK